MEKDSLLLTTILVELVEHPEDVRVNRTVDEMGVLLSVEINPEDVGRVIGRLGSTAKSLRTILRAVGMKNGARVNMRVIEPDFRGGATDVYPGDISNPRDDAPMVL